MTKITAALLFTLTAAVACASDSDSAPLPGDDAMVEMAPLVVTAETGCWLARGTVEDAGRRASPRDSASVTLAGGTLQVCYGGPSARERTIIGGLNPYGEPWRMGADEATALHVTVPVQIGSVRLEPGSYSIFSIPTAESWTVVLNHNAERWGIPLDDAVRAHDLGQVMVTPETIDHVETLRYRFEATGDNRADLIMEFERTRVRIPIQAAME